VKLLQRSLFFLLLICLGCSAQSVPPNLAHAIERQVRAQYKLTPEVQINVGPLKASEFPNYDALKLTIINGNRKEERDFLLSKDGKTLIRMTRMDLTKNPNAAIMDKVDVRGRPTRGNKDAKVVLVNYDDFECPFCSRMHHTLFTDIFREYGDRVLFVYKDYPLAEIHPWATHAAVDANCLAAQNNDAYWELADYLHANQQVVSSARGNEAQFDAVDRAALLAGQQHNVDVVKLHACIKAQNEDAVKASIQEGDSLGVQATPTIFINGEEVDGALPISELRAVLDRALTDAGVQPPVHAQAGPSASVAPAAK
jgi:protein-disulfide isomerase